MIRASAVALSMASAALLAVPASPAGAAVATAYTVKAVQLRVAVGPDNKPCNLDADIYVPASATAAHPAPAVVTTNGYGGNKSQTGGAGVPGSMAAFFAKQGFVAVSYTGLGWGHSGCEIHLDSPAWDGRAAAQVLDYLAGDTSRAFGTWTKDQTGLTAGTWSEPLRDRPPVLLDRPGDARVGFIGTSYGGGAAFAAAQSSPDLDTIIAQATWSDLAYSLAPNDLAGPISRAGKDVGVTKTLWNAGLGAAGGPMQAATGNGGGNVVSLCPGSDPRVCPALAVNVAQGYPSRDGLALVEEASPLRYIDKIRVPVYLLQGESDSLFNLREATATYQALRAQKTPVKMVWQYWGHSDQKPAPGEEDVTRAPDQTLNAQRYLAWMDTHLRGAPDTTGPAFQWYRPWVHYNGSGPDDEQYGTAPGFPAAPTTRLNLSGGTGSAGSLTTGAAASGATSLLTSPDATTSYSDTPVAGTVRPPSDTPGTAVTYTTPALKAPLEIVGSSTLRVRIDAPAHSAAQAVPANRLVLFAKIYDVAPDGTVTLPQKIVSPVRIPDVTKPVAIALPAIVHRFDEGHRLQVVLAQGDTAFRGNAISAPVRILTSRSAPSTLDLATGPSPAPAVAAPTSSRSRAPRPAAAGPTTQAGLPVTGSSPLASWLAVFLTGCAVVARRRWSSLD